MEPHLNKMDDNNNNNNNDSKYDIAEEEWDVIIVGAGQAGMAAAHRLIFEQREEDQRQDQQQQTKNKTKIPLRLLIIEASGHIGGRTRNFDCMTKEYDVISDHVVELGGTWISPSHTSTLDLLKRLHIDVYNASFLPNDDEKNDFVYQDPCGESDDGDEKDGSSPPPPPPPPSSAAPIAEEEEEEEQEFPWWWWGIEYSDDEMRRLQQIVLHVHHDSDDGGGGGDNSNEQCSSHRRVLFSNPTEFHAAFDKRTRRELKYAGQIIDQDCSSILLQETSKSTAFHHPNDSKDNDLSKKKLVWNITSVGPSWKDLDHISTSQRFLEDEGTTKSSPLLTTRNARNILRNCIHNKNAQEPYLVSYFYNLISWGGNNSGPGPDTQFRVRGGTQAIPLSIATKLQKATMASSEKHVHEGKESVISDSSRPYHCRILLGSPVTKIHRENETVEVTTKSGRTFRSRTGGLILTGSPSSIQQHIRLESTTTTTTTLQTDLLFSSEGQPTTILENAPTPKPIDPPQNKMPMGCCIKFMAVYSKRGPWWRRKDYNLQGDILSCYLPKNLSVPIGQSSHGVTEYVPLFPYCFDVSPFSQDCGVLCCFLEGDVVYNYFRSLTKENQETLLQEFLRLSFEDIVDKKRHVKMNQTPTQQCREFSRDESQPTDSQPLWQPDYFVYHDWGIDAEPYVGGAYTSYFPPNTLSHDKYWQAYHTMSTYLIPPNIYIAGSDYHCGYGNGYIEGAIRSGQTAADHILDRLSTVSG